MNLIKKNLFGLKKIFWWIKKIFSFIKNFFLIKNSNKNFSKIFDNNLKKEEIEKIKSFLVSSHFNSVEISATHIVNKLKLSSIECLANNDEERARKEVLMSRGIEFYLGEIRKIKGCK